MNIFQVAMLGAISCLVLTIPANAWIVGERGEANSVFLYDEPIEGVYQNNWWGTAVSSGETGQINVYIQGEGKTVDFDGILSLNCENPSGYFWKTASNFETPVKKKKIMEILPHTVLQNARTLFCRQN